MTIPNKISQRCTKGDTETHKDLDLLSYKIIGLAIEVHRQLGSGLLESAYQECLFYEIKNAGLIVEKEKTLPIIYKDLKIGPWLSNWFTSWK